MQEQAVIDSDLVDRMIAMFRLRWDLIEDNLEKGDYKLVDDIIRLNFEGIHLFLEQVGEFMRGERDNRKKSCDKNKSAVS